MYLKKQCTRTNIAKLTRSFTWKLQRSLLSGTQSLHSRHVPWRPWVECSCNLKAKDPKKRYVLIITNARNWKRDFSQILRIITDSWLLPNQCNSLMAVQFCTLHLVFSLNFFTIFEDFYRYQHFCSKRRRSSCSQAFYVGTVWPACVALNVWARGFFFSSCDPHSRCKKMRRLQGNTSHQSQKVMYGTAQPPPQTPSMNKGTRFFWNSHTGTHRFFFFQHKGKKIAGKGCLVWETVKFSNQENPIVHIHTAAAGGLSDNVCVFNRHKYLNAK